MAIQISNGTSVPHATSYKDLLSKLRTFLTTDSTLVGLGQNWTSLGYTTSTEDTLYLRGPGLGGTDQIYVGVQTITNAGSDFYNWQIAGMTGYNSVEPFTNQPGVSPMPRMHLHTTGALSPYPYWFVANGRRFIVVVKVSTIYQLMYAGFILPYATPNEYPYPLAIGGMAANGTSLRFSDTTPNHRAFFNPNNSLYLRRTDGAWVPYQNFSASGNNDAFQTVSHVFPWSYFRTMRNGFDGAYALESAILHSSNSSKGVFGALDGVKKISGFSNASENTTVEGGVTYLVVQNAHRTAINEYCAIALE